MNCDQIKNKISIRVVLESFNLFPAKENRKTAFYFALERKENTPSFSVDFIKNRAFDFGTGKSYDVISIVQQINKCSVSEALQYLNRFDFSHVKQNQTELVQEKNYEIIKIKDVQHLALLQYLQFRKVLEQRELVKEIHYKTDGKSYFGIGFFNNTGGVEIRNKYSKICLGKKDVTLIRSKIESGNEVCVFEGFFDYLTYRQLQKVEITDSDFLILNSTAMFFKFTKQLFQYKKINLFLDNDLNGNTLRDEIFKIYDNVEDCSLLYQNFKDLNSWFKRSGL